MNQWYYAQDDTQQGPVSETEFLSLVRAGTIDAGTLVWRVGMDEWQTYDRVPAAPRDASMPLTPPPLPPSPVPAGAPRGQSPQGTGEERPKIPSHLGRAIILTVFCCPLSFLGIVAIVYAARVSGRLAAGDVAGAMEASRKANLWCWITVVASFLIVLALFLWKLPDLWVAYKGFKELFDQLSAQELG
jgi:hypothetical protein